MSKKWIFSASEIDTFLTCRKKWSFRYLDGIEPAASKSMELGKSVHTVLENYLLTNQIDYETESGRIASAGLSYLPKTIEKSNIEKQILFSSENHFFNGYIDFFQQLDQSTWLIGDHKTCSTLSSALKPEELKKDTQANIYAQWCFKEKNADVVKLKWIYYRTKSTPQAKIVETELSRNEASENFKNILKVADEIKQIVDQKESTKNLPKNFSACYKYGCCPFYASCRYDTPTATAPIPEESFNNEGDDRSNHHVNSFHLFVDCVPTKHQQQYEHVIELSEFLTPVLEKIHNEKNLKHYRLAGYGQHVGLIANYLTTYLKENTYDSNTAILSSLKTPEGCDTLQTLTAAAGKVVRGF